VKIDNFRYYRNRYTTDARLYMYVGYPIDNSTVSNEQKLPSTLETRDIRYIYLLNESVSRFVGW